MLQFFSPLHPTDLRLSEGALYRALVTCNCNLVLRACQIAAADGKKSLVST
jgi:hypothetical protein